jgi:hypothetical protein
MNKRYLAPAFAVTLAVSGVAVAFASLQDENAVSPTVAAPAADPSEVPVIESDERELGTLRDDAEARLRALEDMSCSGSSFATLWVNDTTVDLARAAGSGANRWVTNSVWVGSVELLADALGGEILNRGNSAAWIVRDTPDGVVAQEILRWQDATVTMWLLGGTINPLDESVCSAY